MNLDMLLENSKTQIQQIYINNKSYEKVEKIELIKKKEIWF